MIGSEANAYAAGLFKLAIETDKVASFQEEVKEVRETLWENPSLLGHLSSYSLPEESQYTLVEKVFGHLKNKEIPAFVRLLVMKHEIIHFELIAEAFNKLSNDYRGIKEGIIYSASPLTKEEVKKIEKSMQKRLGFAVELDNRIDHKLIGGVKVFVDDKVFDSTILGKIERMRSDLLK